MQALAAPLDVTLWECSEMIHHNAAVHKDYKLISRRPPGLNDDIVLSIIRDSNGPIGAYRIAQRSRHLDTRLEPPAVYRSLARLIRRREVERVESVNAYVPTMGEPTIYIVCSQCGACSSASGTALYAMVREHAQLARFEVSARHLEVIGKCDACTERLPTEGSV